jgi:hypothetical protein
LVIDWIFLVVFVVGLVVPVLGGGGSSNARAMGKHFL